MNFKKYRIISLIISVILLFPINIFAAQVLQVNSSSLLKIGDRNRIYTVQLACLEVAPSKEKEAVSWLKSKVKGKKRVNLKPEGVDNGVLLARVSLLDSKIDFAEALNEEGLGVIKC